MSIEDKTKVGNFFISNYPQYSFWKPENVPDALTAINEAVLDDNDLGIYIHIPFCRKRCHFCYFRVYTDKNSSQINDYLDGVDKELSLYVQKEFISDRLPSFIYFGGGTPSYLSRDQFSKLTDSMQAHMSWEQAKEITVECEPGTLSPEKIKNFKDIGITRLSLGIENYDDKILEANNRAHRSKELYTAYETIQAEGFDQVNIDLIAGMIGETDDNWKRCVQEALKMSPDSVTIYQMEIPFNTTIYKEMKESGEDSAPVADWQTKRRWVNEAFIAFEQGGYHVLDAYTVVKNKDNTTFLYREKLWTGADMIGLGVSSFAHINGCHIQNEKDYAPYLEKLNNNELPINRALKINDEEKLIREFILKLKTGKVCFDYFSEKFAVDLKSRYATSLEKLQSEKMITVDAYNILMTREGLLRVDNLIQDFFLPEHQNARYT